MIRSTLASRLAASPACESLVATDGVFSMDGDMAPLADLPLSLHSIMPGSWWMMRTAWVCWGHRVAAVLRRPGLVWNEVPILMGTLGKAFGTFGAFVAGSDDLIETLIQQARTYIYTTAPPPALACATRAALQLVREDDWRREHLQGLISGLPQRCQAAGADVV